MRDIIRKSSPAIGRAIAVALTNQQAAVIILLADLTQPSSQTAPWRREINGLVREADLKTITIKIPDNLTLLEWGSDEAFASEFRLAAASH